MLARGAWLKMALALGVVAGGAGEALARGGRRETGGYETIELSALRSNPKAFIGKRISFDCFFAGLGRIYQPFQTPFVAEQYLNFHVWEPGTKLWDNRDRKNAYLFCFIPRDLEKQTNYIMRRETYESVRLFGRVSVVYANYPWFEVDDVEASAMPSISETALKHIMVGIKSVRNGQFDMAEKSFAEAVNEGLPEDAQNFAQRELGGTYYELGKYEAAADAFAQAALRDRTDAWVLLRLGQSLSRAADAVNIQPKRRKMMLAESLRHLEDARRKDPANPNVHAEMGWVKAKQDYPLDGIKNVREALALEAGEAGASSYGILGRIYVQLRRLEDADDAYNNAIVRDPTNPAYHREVADKVYMPQGRYPEAEAEYKNFIDLTKTEPDGYILRAEALVKQGKYEEALRDYDEAVRLDRDNIAALLGRAAANRELRNYEKASVDLDQAARLEPKNAKVLVARVDVLQAKKEYDRAVDACNDIIAKRVTRDLGPVYYKLGEAYYRKPQPDLKQASAQLGRAVAAEPGNVEYHGMLAEVLKDMGQFARAVKEFQQIKASRPADEMVRLSLSEAMLEAGSFGPAKAELEELVQDMPESNWAKNNLAYLIVEHDRQPDLDRAEGLARAAYDKEAGNAEFQDTLGWIKLKREDVDGARLLLDMAIIKSKRAEPFYHRAMLLKDSEPERAREDIEEALRRLNAMTGQGAATRKLLQDARKLAGSLGASLRPGPKEPAE